MVSELYPFKSNFLDMDGLKYHYVDEGSGDPVVMLHGNPTWSFFYRDVIKSLRDRFRVIVPDHIGCGLSDKPDESSYPYTLKRRVEDVERLLEHLSLKRDITLIVHDWGGMIGMTYASRNRDAVQRFVVMNTAAFHLPGHIPFPLPLWLCRNTPVGPLLVRGLNAFCIGAVMFCCTKKKMSSEVKKAYLSPYDSWKNRVAVLRFVQDIPLRKGDESYEVVSEVEKSLSFLEKKPLLIIWGEKDFVFDRQFEKEWIRRFPDAEVHSFADAGHYILEDAGDEVIPIIGKFLDSHPLPR